MEAVIGYNLQMTLHEHEAIGPLVFGVDLVEIESFGRHLSLGGDRFVGHVYLPSELAECQGHVKRLASRVAAKEATAKALGTGIRGIGWKEIEITTNQSGCPRLSLHHRAASVAEAIGVRGWSISLSHGDLFTVAVVIGTLTPKGPERSNWRPHDQR